MDEVMASIAHSLAQDLSWDERAVLKLGTLRLGEAVRCRETSQAYWQCFDCAPIGLISVCSDQIEGAGKGGLYASLEAARVGLYGYVSEALEKYRASRGDEA